MQVFFVVQRTELGSYNKYLWLIADAVDKWKWTNCLDEAQHFTSKAAGKAALYPVWVLEHKRNNRLIYQIEKYYK